jgi:hypothetical protein
MYNFANPTYLHDRGENNEPVLMDIPNAMHQSTYVNTHYLLMATNAVPIQHAKTMGRCFNSTPTGFISALQRTNVMDQC